MILVGAGSSPAFQRVSRGTLFSILGARLAETWSRHVGSKEMRVVFGILVVGSHTKSAFLVVFRTFRIFVTGGSKKPGNPGLRAAIRTAAHARSGRANDMGGIRE
eukprot:gene14060-biopygen15636